VIVDGRKYILAMPVVMLAGESLEKKRKETLKIGCRVNRRSVDALVAICRIGEAAAHATGCLALVNDAGGWAAEDVFVLWQLGV